MEHILPFLIFLVIAVPFGVNSLVVPPWITVDKPAGTGTTHGSGA